MASGDGVIVRIRSGTRALRSEQLRSIAELAQAHSATGLGQLELTRRANLQLRGLQSDRVASLQHELVQLGLAELDRDVEQRLSLLSQPLSGLDPTAAELAPLTTALEHHLRQAGALAQLPSKFGILLDTLETRFTRLDHVAADIRVHMSARCHERAAVSVTGAHAARVQLGWFLSARVPALVWRLMQLRAAEHDRPRWAAAARAEIERSWPRANEPGLTPALEPADQQPDCALGHHEGSRDWFGVAVPFGSADAAAWLELCALAERYGDGAIRVTPERSLLLHGVPRVHAAALTSAFERLGWITDPANPLLRVHACPGAPACASALGETRAWARTLSHALADKLGGGATLHVSGCGKGCASSAPASVTLVHEPSGCKLGFDMDCDRTLTTPAMSAPAIQRALDSYARESHASRGGRS